jgi:hypothetical protein
MCVYENSAFVALRTSGASTGYGSQTFEVGIKPNRISYLPLTVLESHIYGKSF